jgi:hypothetical protein
MKGRMAEGGEEIRELPKAQFPIDVTEAGMQMDWSDSYQRKATSAII